MADILREFRRALNREQLEVAHALRNEIASNAEHYGDGWAILFDGYIERSESRAIEAHSYFEQSLVLFDEKDDGLGAALAKREIARSLSLGMQDHESALPLIEQAVNQLEEVGADREVIGMTQVNRVMMLQRAGRETEAQELCNELVARVDAEGLPEVFAELAEIRLSVYSKYMTSDEAMTLAGELIAVAVRINSPHKQVFALNTQLAIMFEAGEYANALVYGKQAMKIAVGVKSARGLAGLHNAVGTVFGMVGDGDRSIIEFEKCLAIGKELQDNELVVGSLANIGALHLSKDRLDEALNFTRQALDLAELHGLSAEELGARINLADILSQREEIDSAQKILPSAEECKVMFVRRRIARDLIDSRLQRLRGDLQAAKSLLEKALRDEDESGENSSRARIYTEMRELAKASSDFEGYVKYNDIMQREIDQRTGRETAMQMAAIEKEHELEAIEQERLLEKKLLYGTLPKSVADRMLAGDDVSGDHFDHASVMFLDVVGFTTNSHDLEPRIVTELLDSVFHSFDDLCELHNVTKIKTIGDAYLAVAFQDDENQYSPERNIANVALAIQQLEFTWPDGSPLQFRIGLHSGPVVAGVIGKQRLQYDVWGDTVNVASRMESSGEPGKVHCSESFAEALHDDVGSSALRAKDEMSASSRSVSEGVVRKRGEIEIKGKGTMTTYWLEGT